MTDAVFAGTVRPRSVEPPKPVDDLAPTPAKTTELAGPPATMAEMAANNGYPDDFIDPDVEAQREIPVDDVESGLIERTRARKLADAHAWLAVNAPAEGAPGLDSSKLTRQGDRQRAAAAQPRERPAGPSPVAIAKDVARGVIETPGQIGGGLTDAVNGALELGWWLNTHGGPPRQHESDADKARAATRDMGDPKLPNLFKDAKSVSGGIVRGVTQFLAGFMAMGPVGEAATGIKAAQVAIRGAGADAIFRSGHDKRLSDLLDEVPALKGPVTAYMKSDPNDGEIEGRFKNALEGVVGGVAAEGLFRAVKFIRDANRARAAAAAHDQEAAKRAQAPREAAEMDLLGSESGPLVAGEAELDKLASRALEAATKGDEGAARLLASTKQRMADAKKASGDKQTGDLGVPDDVAARAMTAKGLTPLTEGDKSVYINFGRIQSAEDVKQAIADTAEAFKGDIEAARRGVRSNVETLKASGAVDAWDALMSRREGAPMNAEQSVAARRLWEASAYKLMEVAGVAAQTATPEALYQFRKMLAIHHTIQREVIAARTETARALQSWSIPGGGSGATKLQAINNLLATNGGSEASQLLAARVAALKNIPNGMAALEQVAEKGPFAKSVGVVKEIWVNSLLSSPQTHFVNIIGNSAGLLQGMVERFAAAGYSRAFGSGEVLPGEAAAQFFATRQGIHEGIKLFGLALKTGDAQFGASTTKAGDAGFERAIAASNFNLKRSADKPSWFGPSARASKDEWLGNAVDAAGTMVNMPVRFLSAEDDFFKAVAYRMEVNAQAFRQASREAQQGILNSAHELAGTPYAGYQSVERLRNTIKGWREHAGQARASDDPGTGPLADAAEKFLETFTPPRDTRPDLASRIAELAASPPEHIHMAAVDAALYQTYTQKPGALVSAINALDHKFQASGAVGGQISSLAMRLIAPFRNTPANLVKYAFERTPIAPIMASYRDAIARGGADADIARTRMAMGTMVLLGVMDLALDGHVTGAGPSSQKALEKGTRTTMLRAGWQPYSIRVGDRYWSYKRTDPIGLSIGLGANIAETINNADLDQDMQDEVRDAMFAAAAGFGGQVLDRSWMSDMSDLMQVLNQPDRTARFIDRIGTSMMVPQIGVQARRMTDPNMRMTHNFVTRLRERIPGLSDSLPPARDMWGRERTFQSGMGEIYDAVSPIWTRKWNPEPIDKAALEQDFNLSMPPARLVISVGSGESISLKHRPEVYSEYLETRGQKTPSQMGIAADQIAGGGRGLGQNKIPYGDLALLPLLNAIVTGQHPLSKVYDAASGGHNGGKNKLIAHIVGDFGRLAKAKVLADHPELRPSTRHGGQFAIPGITPGGGSSDAEDDEGD